MRNYNHISLRYLEPRWYSCRFSVHERIHSRSLYDHWFCFYDWWSIAREGIHLDHWSCLDSWGSLIHEDAIAIWGTDTSIVGICFFCMEYRVNEEVLESDILTLATEYIEEVSEQEYQDDPSDNIGKYPDHS